MTEHEVDGDGVRPGAEDGRDEDRDYVEVHLVGLPLGEYEVSAEHGEELRREFALLALRPPEDSAHELPGRLVELMDALTRQYGSFTEGPDATRDAAIAAGEKSVDLTYRVPRSAAQAARELDALLDEADEFCRRGEHLLTLAAPPGAVALRRWYLGEFVAQIEAGAPPRTWADYCRDGS